MTPAVPSRRIPPRISGVRPNGARTGPAREGAAPPVSTPTRIGPPPLPPPEPIAVRPARDRLPSMVRRVRRGRISTLLAYAAAIVVSVLGLIGVARMVAG